MKSKDSTMKTLSFLFIIISISLTCFSQQISGIIYEHQKNNIHPKIDTISIESFNRIRQTGICSGPLPQSIYLPAEVNKRNDSIWRTNELIEKSHSLMLDSIIQMLKSQFKTSIIENDSSLILIGYDKKIKLSKRNELKEALWSSYDFKDYQKDYMVIEKKGYEQREFIVFNPKTRNYKYLEHRPRFFNDSIVFCSDNYYGEGGFQIMQLIGDQYFGFESYTWELEECYRIDKTFYFSFRSSSEPSKKIKYIKIDFDNFFRN